MHTIIIINGLKLSFVLKIGYIKNKSIKIINIPDHINGIIKMLSIRPSSTKTGKNGKIRGREINAVSRILRLLGPRISLISSFIFSIIIYNSIIAVFSWQSTKRFCMAFLAFLLSQKMLLMV